MTPFTLLILALALFILLALAAYALHLWRKIWSQEKALKQARLARHKRLGDDLQILAKSLLDGQLPLIEGAIRIKVLLDSYDVQLSQNKQCAVFQLIYDATSHIPTHAGWKALSKQQRHQHEKLFEQLQTTHQQSAHSAAQWLLEHGLKLDSNA
jgi:hypothetical protein